jgi:hypothetical protein
VTVFDTSPGALDERQWRRITQYIKLPDAARELVEREIIWYRELHSVWGRPPSQVSKNLKRVSDAASKLVDLLEGLEDQERIELIEAWPREPSLLRFGLNRIDAAALNARTVSIACEAVQLSKLSQPTRVDGLIERLDSILHQFSDVGVSQTQAVMTFLVEVFKAADIKLKERSIRFAVERFHTPGKKRKKDFSKSATDSRR